MDNLCHTLTGAAFAEAGLKRYTRFGSAASMIAANLPDVDVLAFLADTPPVALRRGWTHGLLAQALLPIALTGVFVLLDRARPRPHSRSDRATSHVRTGALLAVTYIGVLSHVGMDWLNTYGIRLLMPFSNQWFYGDAVFIVDPWLWLMLGVGLLAARRWRRTWLAGVALALATVYIAVMVLLGQAARGKVVDAWVQARGAAPARVMVGPVPIHPLQKSIIIDAGEYYERGTFAWWPTRVRFDPQHVPKNDRHPAVRLAAETDSQFQGLLVWSRFPYYEIHDAGGGKTRVTLADMRFGRRGLFSATTIVER